MSQETIKQILMRRDGDSAAEAQDRINECKELVLQAINEGDFEEVTDLIQEHLGLEPDYVGELVPGLGL